MKAGNGNARGARKNGTYAMPTALSPLSRECPRCGAKPGRSCFVWVKAAEYARPMIKFHKERQRRYGQ